MRNRLARLLMQIKGRRSVLPGAKTAARNYTCIRCSNIIFTVKSYYIIQTRNTRRGSPEDGSCKCAPLPLCAGRSSQCFDRCAVDDPTVGCAKEGESFFGTYDATPIHGTRMRCDPAPFDIFIIAGHVRLPAVVFFFFPGKSHKRKLVDDV